METTSRVNVNDPQCFAGGAQGAGRAEQSYGETLQGLPCHTAHNDNDILMGENTLCFEVNIEMKSEVLFEEYREGVLECVHHGLVCVVNEQGVATSVGNPNWLCFYRSASKPIQALPVLLRELNKKYGLSEEETAIFSGSHCGDEDHVRVCESILEKTGLREEDMCMMPTYPGRPARRESLLRANQPPRKIYHNCAGKHLALMLLARDLGEPIADYWKRESKTQAEVRDMIAYMSDTPAREIAVGVDGCGVPVFAVPFWRIAWSYLKLSCPDLIPDGDVRRAVEENMVRLHAYPNMIAGKNIVDSIITADDDLIAKSGAMGIYAIGCKSRRLAILFKIADGSHDEFADSAIEAFRQLGIATDVAAQIRNCYPDTITNDSKFIVGQRKPVFRLV